MWWRMWTGRAMVEQPVGPDGGLGGPALFLPTWWASEAPLPAALHSQALRNRFPIPPGAAEIPYKNGRSKMHVEAGGRRQLRRTLFVLTEVQEQDDVEDSGPCHLLRLAEPFARRKPWDPVRCQPGGNEPGLTVADVQVSSFQMIPLPGVGAEFVISLKLQLTGTTLGLVPLLVSVSLDVTFQSQYKMVNFANNTFQLEVPVCNFPVDAIDVSLQGGLISSALNSILQLALSTNLPLLVCPTVKTAIDLIKSNVISMLNVDLPLGSYGLIKFRLWSFPYVTPDYYGIYSSTEIVALDGGILSLPVDALPCNDPPTQTYKLCYGLHPAFLTIAQVALLQLQPLEVTCVPDQVGQQSQFSNAAVLKQAIVSQFGLQDCGAGPEPVSISAELYLRISLVEAPLCQFGAAGPSVGLSVQIKAFTRKPDGTECGLCVFKDNTVFNPAFSIIAGKLNIALTFSSHELLLESTDPGSANVSPPPAVLLPAPEGPLPPVCLPTSLSLLLMQIPVLGALFAQFLSEALVPVLNGKARGGNAQQNPPGNSAPWPTSWLCGCCNIPVSLFHGDCDQGPDPALSGVRSPFNPVQNNRIPFFLPGHLSVGLPMPLLFGIPVTSVQVALALRQRLGPSSGPAPVAVVGTLDRECSGSSSSGGGSTATREMFKLCTLSVLLCLLAPSRGTTPGTVVRVNREALEYMCQEGKPFLAKGLMVLNIPNFVGRRSILGSVLNVVGINILNVQLPHLSVNLIPKTGVQLALSSDFHIRVNLILSPLQLRVASSIMLDIRVMRSAHGFPVLSIAACKSILGDVQIVLGGTNLLGWLTPIRNHIRAVLMDQMCLSVSATVLGLNARLGTLVGLNTINPMSRLQYYMLEQPEITSDYIDLDLNAAFQVNGKPIEVPSTGPAFSLPPQQTVSEDSMVNMGISEHVFANLFATLQQSGAFNLNLGGRAGSGGYHLTTSMLESAIPSVAQRYPQGTSFALNLVLTALPVVDFHEGGALLRISPTVQLVVDAAGPSYQTLCTLGLDITLALKLTVTVTSVQVSAALHGEMGLEVASSTVEIAQINQLRKVVVSVLQKSLMAHLNGMAGRPVGELAPSASSGHSIGTVCKRRWQQDGGLGSWWPEWTGKALVDGKGAGRGGQ
ncbi:hypothetical protein lerEdw1_005006 [Lerista edwardsae]|nr:hypothetical protein lerEdw1_005006 [Lerista edwardsae]